MTRKRDGSDGEGPAEAPGILVVLRMAHPERERELQSAVSETDAGVRQRPTGERVQLRLIRLPQTGRLDPTRVAERKQRIGIVSRLQTSGQQPLAQDGAARIRPEPAAP